MSRNNIAGQERVKPAILIQPDKLSQHLDAAEFALASARLNLFQINGRLVHLVRHNETSESSDAGEKVAEKMRRPPGALVLTNVNETLLLEYLSSAARWGKWDPRKPPRRPDFARPDKKGDWTLTSPPANFARHILARGQWPNIAVLRGTIEAPTLRSDGSVLQQPGYDERSGLYFDCRDAVFPHIANEPTYADALCAIEKLKDVLKDFPFVPDAERQAHHGSASRSVALSAMLTAIVRRSLATAPAHAIDATVMGTGKTKLAELASVLATSRIPTAISQGATPDEFNKRLFSVLLAGDPSIIIDNIEKEVESDEFCSVLTSSVWQNRVLGLSQMSSVSTNSLFLLTGNRMTFKGDITDRLVVCSLDARMEDPKQRRFDRDPVVYAMDQRPQLVAAALTVLRAHAAAGFPAHATLVPSRFPDWDRMVRAALVWIGEPDPQVTRERVAVVDPVRESHTALLRSWLDAVGRDRWVTAQEVIARAQCPTTDEYDKFEWPEFTIWRDDAAQSLDEAISGVLEGKYPNAKRLGRYLMKYEGRIYQGLTLRAQPNPKAATLYALQSC